MNDFAAMNEVYGTFFTEPYPARSTVQAARLPRDARIEIDAIADASSSSSCRSSSPTSSSPSHYDARRARSTSEHPIDAAQRLDHLLEVLEVADLDRHVDARAADPSSVRASMFLMLVLMSAIFALTAASSPFRSSTSIVSFTV